MRIVQPVRVRTNTRHVGAVRRCDHNWKARTVRRNSGQLPICHNMRGYPLPKYLVSGTERQLIDIVHDEILWTIVFRNCMRGAQVVRIDDRSCPAVVSLWDVVEILAESVGQLQK